MTSRMESHCLSFRDIPHTEKLFTAFLDDFASVSRFYAHPPSTAGIDAAARAAQLDPRIRRTVVEVLRQQNSAFGPGEELHPAVSRNLNRLATGSVAIVTGQQTGLFSGPAYTFYKALTALRCAEDATRRGLDAVPIFWLATTDHDLAEVNHSDWNTRNGLAHYELPASGEKIGTSVGKISLSDAIQSIVTIAAGTLEGSFAGEVSRALHESYTPGDTYGSALGKLLARLLGDRGLILIDPLNPELHRLAASVYLRALEESAALRDDLLARSKELEASGFHSQVKVTGETTLLFYSVGGKRESVRSHNGGLLAGQSQVARGELASAIEKTPEKFSASALLRPIVQDTFLPTAAYIGGPAEISYMAQAQVVYKKLLGRMPAVLPRASFSIVEQPVARILEHFDLEFRDVLAGPQNVRLKMEQKSLPGELAAQFESGEETMRRLLANYEEPLTKLDSTLLDSLKTAESKILHQFSQLRAKVARAENFRSGVLDRKERVLLDSLHPNGGLQERTLSFLPFLALQGPELLDKLTSLASIDNSAGDSSCANKHHVLFL